MQQLVLKNYFKKSYAMVGILVCLCLNSNAKVYADSIKQPLVIDKKLIQRLSTLENARQVEQLLGPACCCVPVGDISHEVAICQWKANPKNNSTLNTLNITFEVDRIGAIQAITKDGKILSKKF